MPHKSTTETLRRDNAFDKLYEQVKHTQIHATQRPKPRNQRPNTLVDYEFLITIT